MAAAPPQVVPRCPELESDDTVPLIQGNVNIIKSAPGEFGHYTNGGRYSLIKLYLQAAGGNQFNINSQRDEIFVLSQFFSLYDRSLDEDNIPFFERQSSYRVDQDSFQTGADLVRANIGFQMLLLATGNIMSDLHKRTIATRIEDNLQKYLVFQLLHIWLANYYNTNSYGFRVYFDYYSMLIWGSINATPITIQVDFPDEYHHLLHGENINIVTRWNEFVQFITTFQGALNGLGITLQTRQVPNALLKTQGNFPATGHISNLSFTFRREATCQQRIAGLYFIYTLFANPNMGEITTVSNEKLEFFLYKFNPVTRFVERYNHQIQLPGQIAGIRTQFTFSAAVRNGYIGQLFRYVALGQQSIAGGRARPSIAHFRDAHHLMLTEFEIARLDLFKQSNKRFLLAVGKGYSPGWHHIRSDFEKPHMATVDGYNRNITWTSSLYAGLVSFRSLTPADQCILLDSDTFKYTMGLFLRVYDNLIDSPMDGTDPHHARDLVAHQPVATYATRVSNVKDAICGLRYENGPNTHKPAVYFAYGCDERVLVHLMYTIVGRVGATRNVELVINNPPGGHAPDYYTAQKRNNPAYVPPAGHMNTQIRILSDSLFYTIELSQIETATRDKADVKSIFWNRTNRRSGDIVIPRTDTEELALIPGGIVNFLTTKRNLINDNNQLMDYDTRKVVKFCLTTYIDLYGRLPRNYYQLVKCIEEAKNNITGFSRGITSVYHNLSLLGRRYNVRQLSEAYGRVNPFAFPTIWRTVTPEFLGYLHILGNHLTDDRNNCNFVHYDNNITHFNKGQLVRDFIAANPGTAANPTNIGNFCYNFNRGSNPVNICFSDIQDSFGITRIAGRDIPAAARNPGNQCAVQPKDVSYMAGVASPYSRRGMRFAPSVTQAGGGSKEYEIKLNTRTINKGSPPSMTTNKMNAEFCKLFMEYNLTKDTQIIENKMSLVETVLKGVCSSDANVVSLFDTFKALYPAEPPRDLSAEDEMMVVVDIQTPYNTIVFNKLYTLVKETQAYKETTNPDNPQLYAKHYFGLSDGTLETSFTSLLQQFLILNNLNLKKMKPKKKVNKQNLQVRTTINAKLQKKNSSRVTRNIRSKQLERKYNNPVEWQAPMVAQ